jgi:hypothetical protein
MAEHGSNGLNTVMDKEHLTATFHLSQDGLPYQARRIRSDMGDHRQAFLGGVLMVEISRTPVRAMYSVRGIGVAVIVRTSTSVRICLSFSLWVTPKRCSSSMMSKPRSLKFYIALDKAVSADNDIQAAIFKAGDDFTLLLGCGIGIASRLRQGKRLFAREKCGSAAAPERS